MIKKKFFAILTIGLLIINTTTTGATLLQNQTLTTSVENFSTEKNLETTTISDSIKLETRSKDDIKNMYKKLQTSLNRTKFEGNIYKEKPIISAPYKSGSLTDNFVQDGLNAINFFRYIVGLPSDIIIDPVYTNKIQHGATLLSSINKLTHHPTKPNDMSQGFFDIAYSGTKSSNLASGYSSLSSSIRAYLDDSDSSNIDKLGHRRWVLNPSMQKTGFGFADRLNKFSGMYSFDNSRKESVDYDYISWPAKNIHPVEYFNSHEAWSISLNPTKFSKPSYDDVKVNIKRLSDNKTWTLDKNIPQENKNDRNKAYFNVNNNNFGINNAIIFRLENIEYKDGDKFEVTVSGIKDKNGNDTSIKYFTEFFSVKPNLSQNMTKVDKAYKVAYDSTMSVNDAKDLLEKQTLITTARLSLAKLNSFPNQTNNIRTFSAILDKPQHDILVNIVDSINTCKENLNQSNINIARNNIPANLPNNANWLNTYSQSVDKLQTTFINNVQKAVKLAKKQQTESSINIAKDLASDLATSISDKISKLGRDLLNEVNNITPLN